MGKKKIRVENGKPLGVAWYKRDQWEKLLEMSADCSGLEKSYDEWLAGAEKAVKKLEKQGCTIVKVDIDVIEMASWCIIQGIPVNKSSRSRYVIHKMEQNQQG